MLLLVGPSPERAGGIATWLRLTRAGLAERSPSLPVRVFATDKAGGGGGALPARLVDGAKVAARFRAEIAAHRPTLVHIACGSGWGLREAGALGAIAKAADLPVVVHLHAASLFERMDASSFERLTSHAVLRVADRVAVLGDAAQARLADAGIPSHVCPNGVPLPERATPVPEAGPLLVLGSVEERKGLSVLSAALDGLDVRVRWVGPVRAPASLVAAAEARGVDLAGPCVPAEVPAEIAAAAGLLLPSLREGLPYAVLEAMAAGRGVIASRVGALGSVVREGGLLVPPGDSDALRTVLRDWESEAAARWGDGARRDVARGYTLDHALTALEALWAPWLGTSR